MFITVLYEAPKLRDVTFQDELITHLIETGKQSKAKHVVCGGFNHVSIKSLQ